jgi:predicted  nucleic acid-binding Zn-ribbon protein
MNFSRKGAAEVAKDISAHLTVVDDVANLQKLQKEMADAIAKLSDRINRIEAAMQTVKVEAQLEAVREANRTIQSVQGAFFEKLTDLTVRLSHVEAQPKPPIISFGKPAPALEGATPSA